MRRLLFPLLVVMVIIIGLFVGFPGLEETFSSLIEDSANQTKAYFAVISFLLLAADVFLPIPSSIVMFLNGSVLGLGMGMLLSLISSLVSSVIGYYFGKLFHQYLNKRYKDSEKQNAERIITKYGFAGIIATRGVPILSEAVSILAGNMAYHFGRFFLANLIGLLPICLLYAFIGSQSLDTTSFLWAFGINILVAGLFLSVNLMRARE